MLIEEYRNNLIENVHDGRISITDHNGKTTHFYGDISQYTYYRSCAKPFQVLPLIMRGIDKKYNLTQEELTVCAASHTGQKIHIDALKSIMEKTKLSQDDMIISPALPIDSLERENIIKANLQKSKLYHNCSGKHLALMLLQRELTGSEKNYHKLDSKAQNEVIDIIAHVSNAERSKIMCGIDGCGVPVFALPLNHLSLAFSKLACPNLSADSSISSALNHIQKSIKNNPYMISGTKRLASELNTLDNFIAKDGAEGVFAFGLIKEQLGIALKLNDGSFNTWPIIIAHILRELNINDKNAFNLLNSLMSTTKTNHNNDEIGSFRAVFSLSKA